jgi:multiple sugar transport system ATP-binding protein
MATVTLRGLTKRYGKTRAVEDLNLTVDDGEFFVLLGPSGAGKTTTLSLIAGLEPPDAGEVLLGDEPVTGLNPWKRDVAMAFESYALYPHMSVFDNIAFPLRAPARTPRLSEQEIKAQVQRIATMLQIDMLLDRAPSQLSGGQRQRTSLGRMLVRQPRAFLMDEPIVHLDAKLRHHMRGELKQLHEQFAVTTLYATPDWVEAVAMGHRIAVLNRGRVVQIGTPDEIYNHPLNRFVADFVGEPPMNILDGRLVRQNGSLHFDLGGASIDLDQRFGQALEQAGGTEWQLGIRPAAVRLSPTRSEHSPIPATVFVSEPLGRDTVVETRIADQAVAVKMPGLVSLPPGTPVWLGGDVADLHAFDKRTGNRLPLDRGPRGQRPAAAVLDAAT